MKGSDLLLFIQAKEHEQEEVVCSDLRQLTGVVALYRVIPKWFFLMITLNHCKKWCQMISNKTRNYVKQSPSFEEVILDNCRNYKCIFSKIKPFISLSTILCNFHLFLAKSKSCEMILDFSRTTMFFQNCFFRPCTAVLVVVPNDGFDNTLCVLILCAHWSLVKNNFLNDNAIFCCLLLWTFPSVIKIWTRFVTNYSWLFTSSYIKVKQFQWV